MHSNLVITETLWWLPVKLGTPRNSDYLVGESSWGRATRLVGVPESGR